MRLTILCLQNIKMKYWQRYVERAMYENSGYTLIRREYPIVGWKESKKENWHYDHNRPWTDEFKRLNAPDKTHKKIHLQPVDWCIFKGDRVKILVGKDKGKIGIVNCIIKERNWVFVDGLNFEYIYEKESASMPPTCKRSELPLLVPDQVKLVDPSDNEPTDIEWRYREDGRKVRVSPRTGRIIPRPVASDELEDFVSPSSYIENKEKDTDKDEVTKITYKPKLLTFEEEIDEIHHISDKIKRAETYWY